MKDKFRVGILSTIDNPLLPLFIESILCQEINNIVVICDEKKISIKDKKIWKHRTGEFFKSYETGDKNIYANRYLETPFYFVKNHNSNFTQQLINSLSINVLLNAGTPRKLSKEILQSAPYGVVNVHPGLLPEYRGCSAVEWAIFNNNKIGNTAHFMTEGYDEGPIIKRECYEFPKGSNYQFIRTKVYMEAGVLAAKALKKIKTFNIKPTDGIDQDERYAKYWSPIPEDKFKKVLEKLIKGDYIFHKK